MFHRNNAKNSRIRLERRKKLLKVLRLSTTVRLLRQKLIIMKIVKTIVIHITYTLYHHIMID